ncbi:MAG TPA: HAD hydrolase-like protein [Burkholderiaceae bacterium]
MNIRLAIFDFDGTLADTFPFFVSVHNTLAERYQFRSIGHEEIDALRHHGAREVMRQVGLPRWKFPFVARAFMKLMKAEQSGIALFDGVEAALAELAASGTVLAVVSANSYDNIVRILGPQAAAHFRYFECGVSMFGKTRRLKRVLKLSGVAAHEAMYIGDQKTDLEAAHDAGMAFGAVAWGYAHLVSMRKLGVEREFHTVAELGGLALPAQVAA